jgi:NTP pyrophosphatase (non-canonical NTP hydrolase)
MGWLAEFAKEAAKTDRFKGKPEHVQLLAAGLMGEAGSVVAEFKKERRETTAYPAYRHRMQEEIGDFLWYYVRLVSILTRKLLPQLEQVFGRSDVAAQGELPSSVLSLGAAVGELLAALAQRTPARKQSDLSSLFIKIAEALIPVADGESVDFALATRSNIEKIERRWPQKRVFAKLFDDDGRFPEEEMLPRHLQVEFRERGKPEHPHVILRCNNLNFGDRLTDNIGDADYYRFHDVFHFAYGVFLGWSPVTRALLKCKRKSNPLIDETQDGARATIIEEAVSALVFNRAKHLNAFDGLDHVDFDLLKTIEQMVEGFEVASIPYWQWEMAILEGYKLFRKLRDNKGGTVKMDMLARTIKYYAPMRGR